MNLHRKEKDRFEHNESSLTAKLQIITDWVLAYRKRHNIVPTSEYKPELSCEGFGEGYNLLFRQLVTTTDDSSVWRSLENNPKLINLVLKEIKKQDK